MGDSISGVYVLEFRLGYESHLAIWTNLLIERIQTYSKVKVTVKVRGMGNGRG